MPISAQLQNHLAGIVKAKKLGKKEYLLNKGSVCRHIYFIRSGMVRRFHLDGDNEITTCFMRENEIVYSVPSFCDQSPSNEFIQAIARTEVLYINFDELQYMLTHFPEFHFIYGKILVHCHALAEERNHILHMQLTESRVNYMWENHPGIMGHVPRKQLASYLRCTPVNLSRVQGKR
jgi:CRP-like cAMP-binding protein